MKKLIVAVSIMVSTLFLAGCEEESTRQSGVREQEGIMSKAIQSSPTYVPNNFLTRRAVNKWMERMDVPDKTFYIYLMGNNGNHIGYYVGQTRPICSSTLLTPPDRNLRRDGQAVVSAPSLDGVYAGGECSSYFFFDAETDAYIEIQGLNFFVSDMPLNLDVQAITVRAE